MFFNITRSTLSKSTQGLLAPAGGDFLPSPPHVDDHRDS